MENSAGLLARTRPASNGSLVASEGNRSPGVCDDCVAVQPPRHASAEPEARHVTSFLLRLVCRVSSPAQKEKGAGFKTRGRGLPLVATSGCRSLCVS